MPSRRMRIRALLRAPVLLLLAVVALLLPASLPASAAAPTLYPLGVGADLGPQPFTLGLAASAGDDAGALRTGTQDGTPFEEHFMFADTFVNRNGQWVAIYTQVTPFAPPPAAAP